MDLPFADARLSVHITHSRRYPRTYGEGGFLKKVLIHLSLGILCCDHSHSSHHRCCHHHVYAVILIVIMFLTRRAKVPRISPVGGLWRGFSLLLNSHEERRNMAVHNNPFLDIVYDSFQQFSLSYHFPVCLRNERVGKMSLGILIVYFAKYKNNFLTR